MKKSLIVIITPTSSQPRFHKRISALAKFSKVIIFSFRRGLYEVNNFHPEANVYDLGYIKDRSYFGRIYPIIKAIITLKKNIPTRYNNIQFYAFSIDCLFIAIASGIKEGVLEVGDLILLNTSNKWFRSTEKMIFKFINGLILTSKEYYNQYYKNLYNNSKTSFYFIENKVPKEIISFRVLDKKILSHRIKPITIGLIGFLRYEMPIIRLIKFIKRNPKLVTLRVFGDGPCKTLVQEHLSDNIKFYGSFKNPSELHHVYNQIDINYVVYDARNLNVRLAIPNKLYESAFFAVPIICSSNTYLSKIVNKWQIGCDVETTTQEQFDNDMFKVINEEWINDKINKCIRIPNSILIDNQEIIIKKILNKGNY